MISVTVNGTGYKFFETIAISRSIDNSAGVFSLTTSSTPDAFPIKEGDQITISVNNIPKIYGFVDELTESGDKDSHTVQITGRDNTSDLIDSTVPDEAKVIDEQITLKAMCEKVISSLGIQMKVVDSSGQENIFTENDLQAAESGDCAMNYLQSYARKKQVFLIPSGDGKLVIYRPGAEVATTELIHNKNENINNVKSYSSRKSRQGRYNKYYVRSQDNIGFFDDADYGSEGTNRTGIVTDDSIRTGRYLEIVAEESMNDKECLERSKEEANIRRARSKSYTAVVAGDSQADGTPWDIGLRVNVRDEIAGINGAFLIRSFDLTQSVEQGTETKITCAPIDAYKVQAVETGGDRRTSSSNGTQSPPEQSRLPR